MKTLKDFKLINKKVLLRVDFNVPLDKETFKVTDDTRMRAALPSINEIISEGGSVILMSHLGRPKGNPSEELSMRHVIPQLEELVDATVKFSNDCVGPEAEKMVNTLKPGEILLLENLRFHKEEEKGDPEFAKKLAALGDIYINDAFGTAHRAHASTAVIAQYFPGTCGFGFLMAEEIKNLEKVVSGAASPYTAIIGGAKVSDKILVLERLLTKADNILIGGGMSYTFLKAKGLKIGNSLCEDDRLDVAREILKKAEENNISIYLPDDHVIADEFAASANHKTVEGEIPEGWMALDIGPKSAEKYKEVIESSATILWNGPMGVFEMEPFSEGTKKVAEGISEATQKGAYSLVGGGDSVAAVNKFRYNSKVSYVSTGGGAMLEYLEGKELPGIVEINKHAEIRG